MMDEWMEVDSHRRENDAMNIMPKTMYSIIAGMIR
jgi:hypothetical protein